WNGQGIEGEPLKLLTDYYIKSEDAKLAIPFLSALLKNKNKKILIKENEVSIVMGKNVLKTSISLSAHGKITLNDQEFTYDPLMSFEKNLTNIQEFIVKSRKVTQVQIEEHHLVGKYFDHLVSLIATQAWGREVSTQTADELDNALVGGILLLGEGFNSLPYFNFYNQRNHLFNSNFWQIGTYIINYKNKCKRDLERDPETQNYSFTYEGTLPLLIALDKIKDHPDKSTKKEVNGLVSDFFGSSFKGKLSCATLLAKVKNFNMHAITAYASGIQNVREKWTEEYQHFCHSYEELRECLETLAHRETGRIAHERKVEAGQSAGDYDYSQDTLYNSRSR
ncbi:MAG: hypothetical protein AABY86_10840, partial [Bdellovibrionota bacterium]